MDNGTVPHLYHRVNAVLDHEHGATDIQRKGTVPYSTVHILNRGISRHLRNTGIRRVVMENVDPAEALAGDRTKVADTLFLGQIYRTCHSRSTCRSEEHTSELPSLMRIS